jgi:hypothetical protein
MQLSRRVDEMLEAYVIGASSVTSPDSRTSSGRWPIPCGGVRAVPLAALDSEERLAWRYAATASAVTRLIVDEGLVTRDNGSAHRGRASIKRL